MKKACIVGFGSVASLHAKFLEIIPDVSLFAVCDISEKRLEAAKKEYPYVKTFESYDEVLSCEDVDCVHICTPHYLHLEMIKKALSAKKSVICEKPVTITKSEFDELLALEGAEDVCVVFQNRFNPCMKKIMEIVESKTYGDVLEVSANVRWSRKEDYYKNSLWRGRLKKEGGGVLINQSIHTLDLMLQIGGEVSSVSASTANLTLQDVIEVEDTASASIEFSSGAIGFFSATNCASKNHLPEIKVTFENAEIIYSNEKLCINGEVICSDDFNEKLGKKYWGMGHKVLFDNYYGKGDFISPVDVKNTMNTLFAIYESANNNNKRIHI